ncbi:hypothetical protein F5B19DRAFT_402161 [Rostrohypoxylon terebratum]|nr:hypothetical protein F5B19DRAFT_402161 [Rostrohypoxylon terebratum]
MFKRSTTVTPTSSSSPSTSITSAVQVPVLSPPFNPSPSCTQDIYYVVNQDIGCVDSNGSTVACRQFHLGPTTSTSACFPTSWSPSSGAYISPGGCPVGYTVACASTNSPERTATCCPSGYSCQTQSEGFPWYTTDLCIQRMAESITYLYTTRTPGEDPETSTTTGGGTLNAFGVAIRWHASDLATETTSVSRLAGPTIISVSQGSGGLSSGAKAGLGVGVAIAGILVLVGAFLLWRRRRRHRGEASTVIRNQQPIEQHHPGKSPWELDGSHERVELPGRSLPAELGSGRE